MSTHDLLCVASLAVATAGLLAALATCLRARRMLAAAVDEATLAEHTLLFAQAAEEHAGEQLAMATARRSEAERIEELLVCPRWVLNLVSGRVRALLHGEEPDLAIEVECSAPDPDCKEGCGGRGWRGRDTNTLRVIPCKCVKRELHRRRVAGKG